MKRTITILLALAMILASFGAFAEVDINLEGYPIVDEPITLSLSGPRSAQSKGWSADVCAQVAFLTELTGIQFEDRSFSSEAWNASKNLVFAGDDIPDLILDRTFSTTEIFDLGSQGLIIPLNDLIEEYMPNLQALFEEYTDAKVKITSADGNIYTFPFVNAVVRDVHPRYWINVEWLKNVDKEIPTTLDELYDVLVAFKEQDANGDGDADNEIPVSASEGNYGLEGMILNAYGVNVNKPLFAFTNDFEGNVYCANTSEGYKAYLKYMNKLWNDQLLDAEYFTQTDDQRVAKAKQGIIGCCRTAAMYIDAGTEIGYNWEQFDALTSDLNDTRMVTASSFVSTCGMITAANKYPEATCRLIDYFFGEEGNWMGYVGVEGVSWEWTDKEAGLWDKIAPEGYETAEVFRHVATIVESWPHRTSAEFNKGQGSFNALWLDNMSYERSMPYFVNEFPSLSFSEEDGEIINKYQMDLSNYVSSMRVTFITGTPEAIDAGWDAYVEQINAMGVDEMLPIYQAAYTAYLEIAE